MINLLSIGDHGPLSLVLSYLDVAELSNAASSSRKVREICGYEWQRRDEAMLPLVRRSVANSALERVQRFAMAQSLARRQDRLVKMLPRPSESWYTQEYDLEIFDPSTMATRCDYFVRFLYRKEGLVIWEGLLQPRLGSAVPQPLDNIDIDMSDLMPSEMKWDLHRLYRGITSAWDFYGLYDDVAITVVGVDSFRAQLVSSVGRITHMVDMGQLLKVSYTLGPRGISTACNSYNNENRYAWIDLVVTAERSVTNWSLRKMHSLRLKFGRSYY